MGKHKILIVDDDSVELAIARAMLENDYDVTTAKSGREGLGYMRKETLPDLVLVDMIMPGVDGLEFIRTVRGNDQLPEIPIILMSSENTNKEVRGSYTSGTSDFITKPLEADILNMKVRLHLHYLDIMREKEQLKENIEKLRKQFNKLFPIEPK